jgi:hypothetical protein
MRKHIRISLSIHPKSGWMEPFFWKKAHIRFKSENGLPVEICSYRELLRSYQENFEEAIRQEDLVGPKWWVGGNIPSWWQIRANAFAASARGLSFLSLFIFPQVYFLISP